VTQAERLSRKQDAVQAEVDDALGQHDSSGDGQLQARRYDHLIMTLVMPPWTLIPAHAWEFAEFLRMICEGSSSFKFRMSPDVAAGILSVAAEREARDAHAEKLFQAIAGFRSSSTMAMADLEAPPGSLFPTRLGLASY
jgi:hypothetical protein